MLVPQVGMCIVYRNIASQCQACMYGEQGHPSAWNKIFLIQLLRGLTLVTLFARKICYRILAQTHTQLPLLI
jgi:hypothetical protein